MQSDPSNRSKAEYMKASDLQKLAECYQPLFDLMHDEHGKILLNEEMDEIMIAAHAVEQNLRAFLDMPSLPPSGEEETAVGFARFTSDNNWYHANTDVWIRYIGGLKEKIKSAELYTLYLESKTQGK